MLRKRSGGGSYRSHTAKDRSQRLKAPQCRAKRLREYRLDRVDHSQAFDTTTTDKAVDVGGFQTGCIPHVNDPPSASCRTSRHLSTLERATVRAADPQSQIALLPSCYWSASRGPREIFRSLDWRRIEDDLYYLPARTMALGAPPTPSSTWATGPIVIEGDWFIGGGTAGAEGSPR